MFPATTATRDFTTHNAPCGSTPPPPPHMWEGKRVRLNANGFFFFCGPAISARFVIFVEIFTCVTSRLPSPSPPPPPQPALSLPIEIDTFRLRRWFMLDVFLLLALIPEGHEYQDLQSECDGMHVCTDKTSVYILIRKSKERGQKLCLFQGKNPFNQTAPRRVEPMMLHHARQRALRTTN